MAGALRAKDAGTLLWQPRGWSGPVTIENLGAGLSAVLIKNISTRRRVSQLTRFPSASPTRQRPGNGAAQPSKPGFELARTYVNYGIGPYSARGLIICCSCSG